MPSVQESPEFKNYLKTFRVKELKDLLVAAGKHTKGYKADLLQRCMELECDENIQLVIKTLLNMMTGMSRDVPLSRQSHVQGRVPRNEPAPIKPPEQVKKSNKSIADDLTDEDMVMIESLFDKFKTKTAVIDSPSMKKMPAPVSQVKSFRSLAFYDELSTLVEARELKNNYGTPNAESILHCALEIENVPSDVKRSSLIKNGIREYQKQVHIRFGYIDKKTGSNIIEDGIPADLHVTVNGGMPELPEQKKRHSGQPVNRYFRTIDVTHLLKMNNNMPDRVKVFWKNSEMEQRSYYVGVSMVEKKNIDDLFKDLTSNKTTPEELTTNMVKSKLQTNDDDFEYENNALVVSLKCPLMATRISLPGRSTTCNHVQCFDLKSYLFMNENKPLWICPVCSQKASYDTLQVDGLFQRILRENSDVLEVSFQQDGSWTSTLNTSKQESGYNSNDEGEAMETDEPEAIVISLDSDSDSEPVIIELD